MKNFIKKNAIAIFIIALMMTMGSLFAADLIAKQNIEHQYEIQDLKRQAQDVIYNLETDLKAQSDIELLEEQASNADKDAKKLLNSINKAKLAISKAEPLYEKSLLRKKCVLEQMERMVNSLEYNLDYCKNDTNLDQYRTKKY